MYDTYVHAIGLHVSVDQLALSLRAAKSVELQQAAREGRLDRKAQRKAHRERSRILVRRHGAYTTAV